MVRWLGPRGLSATAMQVLLSTIFGAYSDKREIQAALKEPSESDFSDHDELWFDFLADTGDGFNPTYTTATLLARDQLVLVDGGEEVETAAGPAARARRRPGLPGGDADAVQRALPRADDPRLPGVGGRRRPADDDRVRRQPRLVRRPHDLPAAVLRRPAHRRMAHRADPQLLRRRAPAPLVDPGHRPGLRLLHRHAADGLLPQARRGADPARRPRDPR